jgi:hypothetical protein
MDPRASGEDPVRCVHRGEHLFGVRSSTSVQSFARVHALAQILACSEGSG